MGLPAGHACCLTQGPPPTQTNFPRSPVDKLPLFMSRSNASGPKAPWESQASAPPLAPGSRTQNSLLPTIRTSIPLMPKDSKPRKQGQCPGMDKHLSTM